MGKVWHAYLQDSDKATGFDLVTRRRDGADAGGSEGRATSGGCAGERGAGGQIRATGSGRDWFEAAARSQGDASTAGCMRGENAATHGLRKREQCPSA